MKPHLKMPRKASRKAPAKPWAEEAYLLCRDEGTSSKKKVHKGIYYSSEFLAFFRCTFRYVFLRAYKAQWSILGRFSFVSAFYFREKRVNGRYCCFLLHSFFTLHVWTPISLADLADNRRRTPITTLTTNCLSLRDNAVCCIPLHYLWETM